MLKSNINEEIRTDLEQATKYAEGRGVRIEVNDSSKIPDIKTLVDIKLSN